MAVGDYDFFQVSDHSLKFTAAVFEDVARKIDEVLQGAAEDLHVTPWLGADEPVSRWAADRFNEHFGQFRDRLTALSTQHQQLGQALHQARLNYLATDGHAD